MSRRAAPSAAETGSRRDRPHWSILVFLVFGVGLVFGGFSVYRDQHSGVAGTAKVTGCEGRNGKYAGGVHCRGIWTADEHVATGPVEGAHKGDVGSTIDVRIHGSDHATVPSLGTPIVLWALGGAVALLALLGLRPRRRGSPGPRTLAVPPAIHAYLCDLVRLRFTGQDPRPRLDVLPQRMLPGTVVRLVSGGPFGWLIDARLDEVDGRIALEALEDDRMSGPDHYRVWDDNRAVQEALRERGFLRP